jgi:hypothetical protein
MVADRRIGDLDVCFCSGYDLAIGFSFMYMMIIGFLSFSVDRRGRVSFHASSGAIYSELKRFWDLGILFCTFSMIECDDHA